MDLTSLIFVLFSGFANLQEQWLERYENENFPSLIQKVWSEELSFPDGQKISLEKFYKQLHAYVRRKLRNFYSDQVKHMLENYICRITRLLAFKVKGCV